jgi:uncharacterized protein YbaP (TraB family)
MKKWLKTLAATCAIVPFAQCAMIPGGNVARAAQPVVATAPATVDAKPALWAVEDEDTTIYLFGTVHVLKPGLSWFDEAVKDAFDKSDQVMLEVVLPEDQAEMAGAMLPLAIDQSGKTLSSRLDADQLTAYQAAMASVGIPAAQFEMFKPWFVGVTLSVLPLAKYGYDPEQGAEKQLTKFAKAGGKPIAGLETLTQQLGFFDGLPDASQVSFLNSVVKDLDQMGPILDKLVTLWAKGDPDGLAVVMNESMAATPELTKILLWDRNANWADQLQARMDQPGTVFVAVGAGHLAGENSVQDYLKERGLTATRIDY